MRTGRKVAWIVGLIFLLSACGGSGGGDHASLDSGEAACGSSGCDRGPDDDPAPGAPLACGGAEAAACPAGYHCVAEPSAGCDPATGVDCRGLCVLGEELPACGGLAAEPCPDGQACVDDPTDECEGGAAADCPGVCRPMSDGECSDDADCPVLEAPCTVCADGSASCPAARCDGGKCTVDFDPCSEAPVCDGLSGLSCPPGFECIDDPADDCAPDDEGADCRGICVPREVAPPECGGLTGGTCPAGFECVDDPSDDCDPADGGADCAGLCEPVAAGECTSDEECPAVRVPCSVCPDGMEACPRSFCENGRCNLVVPACPVPEGCSTDSDCPPGHLCVNEPNGGCDPATGVRCGGVCVPDAGPRPCGGLVGDVCPEGYECVDDRGDDCDPNEGDTDCPGFCEPAAPTPCRADDECVTTQACRPCPDGSLACPRGECLNGACITAYPGCTEPAECRDDAECASIQAPCSPCPDGTFSCPRAECREGMCVVVLDACRGVGFCGGIAGFPCPPGFTCIDDPADDCEPNRGGADCGGLCVREEEPLPCAGFLGETCPEGFECVDAPDDCDPENGGADCPGFCRPSPSRECAGDSDCPALGAPCLLCADGTAACPRSFCGDGQCKAEFPGCGENG